MANFQRYQPRRSSRSLPWRRLVFVVIGIVAILLLTRSLLGGTLSTTTSQTDNSNADQIRLITDNSNSAVSANTNSEPETETDLPAGPVPDAGLVSLDHCDAAISRFGSAKVVALTFNIAAANEEANILIDVLTDTKLPASFFSSGSFAESNPSFLEQLTAAGHGVYNRTNTSPNLTELTTEQTSSQLSLADEAVAAATGISTKPFMRPPHGAIDDDVVLAAKAAGYCTILWTVDAFDWSNEATAQSARARVLDKLDSGAIIMLSAGYDVTAEAVRLIAKDLDSQGYRAVSLVELMTQE